MLGLLAAAAHDVDHPGVNQPFLIKTNHHLANLYQVREPAWYNMVNCFRPSDESHSGKERSLRASLHDDHSQEHRFEIFPQED